MHFGSDLERALEKAVEIGKRRKPMSEAMKNQKTQEVLRRWLGEDTVAPRKYRDPVAKLRERGNA